MPQGAWSAGGIDSVRNRLFFRDDLRLGTAVESGQCTLRGHVSGLVTGDRRREDQALAGHEFHKVGDRFALELLPRSEEIAGIRAPQHTQSVVEVAKEP